jgi:AcrR family transcriptional regulator
MDETSLKPRKRPGQLRARETVDRILDAAAHIFETEGYARTTTNHIATEATISIGSLYQYYPNKDAIIVGLAERHIASISAQFSMMISEFRRHQPPITDVVRALLEASSMLTGTSQLHALLLTGCPRTTELDAQLRRFENTVTAQLAELLSEANVETTNVKLLSRLLFVAADVALHQVVLPKRTKRERQEAIDELAQLLTWGLAATKPSADKASQ